MTSSQILNEIRKLPADERLRVAEAILQEVRNDLPRKNDKSHLEAEQERMRSAAKALSKEYSEDRELTAFLALDGEDFRGQQ